MPSPPYGEWSPEQKALRNVMKAVQGLVAHRNWLRNDSQARDSHANAIALCNDALANLKRVKGILEVAAVVDDEFQLEFDW